MAHYFVVKQGYRILNLSKDYSDIWLEKFENKERPIIRLKRVELTWSNWLKKDRDVTAINGERIRKRFYKKNLKVTNLYISQYPPVDSYDHLLEPLVVNKGKTEILTRIISNEHYDEYIEKYSLPSYPLEGEWSEDTIEYLKNDTLTYAMNEMNKEKNIFEHSKPFFTYILIAIQVIMFLLLELNGGSTNEKTLMEFGAKVNPLIVEGEWWRFFTPVLLHIGFLHLVMNTMALYFLGTAVEKIFGKLRFIWIYIVAGFSGTVASFLFSPSLSAGASGAIFGCFGALLYFGVINPRLFARTMGANVLLMIGINLAFGFTVPGIDNAGHIGGLIGGFLATGIVHIPKQKNVRMQMLWSITMILIFLISLPYGYANGIKNSDPYLMTALAHQYNQEKEYETSYSLLTDYLSEYEDPPAEAYFVLSYAEIHLQHIEEAKKHLQMATQMKNNFHEAFYNLAILYRDEGNLKQAKLAAEKAVNIKKDVQYENLLNAINSAIESVGEEE